MSIFNTSVWGSTPEASKLLLDFVIVSNRGISKITNLFKEAAKQPNTWARHNFIVVYETEDEAKALKKWAKEASETMTLPKITVCVAAPANKHNVSALRQQGLDQGINPYVYFGDDDDPLPRLLDKCMNELENSPAVAVYGRTKSMTARQHTVEEFPKLTKGNFAFNPVEAMRYCPTYAHPLAAVFKRNVFKRVPIYDGRKYACTGSYSFATRLFHSGLSLKFVTDIIKEVIHHAGNSNGIFEKGEAINLANDMSVWGGYVGDEKVKAFQNYVIESLRAGSITTYLELDAHTEMQLEKVYKMAS